ncbi:Lipid phosphate phosphatase [Seminavis robusta]|uniref:Lipid phosphate phosphatase n=1 Tax=Seminavis robusta TaxID=568900 RepID=A0A9N8DSR9_9STRA|nr:Lipid phosphate phosphatase [Seminavis robusta]|eukprot:Sro252_g099530.1 Lipid phosphate phosphatase (388) ;mRNA; f:12548-13813
MMTPSAGSVASWSSSWTSHQGSIGKSSISLSPQGDDENKEPGKRPELLEIKTISTEESGDSSENSAEGDDTKGCRLLCRQFYNYLFHSHDGKELLLSAIIGIALQGLSYLLGNDPSDRPIPYQFVEATGTYVLNLSYNLESRGDTIPDWAIAVLAIIVCPGVQFLSSFVIAVRNNTNPFGSQSDVHRTLCAYLLTISVTNFLTWALKSYMSIYRPDYYTHCQPNETYEYCTNTDGDKGEFEFAGSFPSGHASYTFCSLTLLTLYLERTFGLQSIQRAYVIVDKNKDGLITPQNNLYQPQYPARLLGIGYQTRRNWPVLVYRLISFLCSAPLIVGCFMAASRVVDNRHHPSDIVAGILLGSFIGYYFHTTWFDDPKFSNQEKRSRKSE